MYCAIGLSAMAEQSRQKKKEEGKSNKDAIVRLQPETQTFEKYSVQQRQPRLWARPGSCAFWAVSRRAQYPSWVVTVPLCKLHDRRVWTLR